MEEMAFTEAVLVEEVSGTGPPLVKTKIKKSPANKLKPPPYSTAPGISVSRSPSNVKKEIAVYDKATGKESLQFPTFVSLRKDKTEVSYD